MAHTTKTGKIFVTYILDGGDIDIITPERFKIDTFVWNANTATDKLIVREYNAVLSKTEMPKLPLYTGSGATVAFSIDCGQTQLLIDYAASTTPASNIVTLIGHWM